MLIKHIVKTPNIATITNMMITFSIVSLISIGYVSALADLPVFV